MYVVSYQMTATAPVYYLRGTVWTSERDRASKFEHAVAAQEAIDKAAKFNQKAAKKAKIENVD